MDEFERYQVDVGERSRTGVVYVVCPRCENPKARLEQRTDGSGNVVDAIECESVNCRRAASAFRARPGWKLLWCESCGRPFSRRISRGRYPKVCPSCR